MLTKYASFESSEVLDIKGSKEKIHTASLDKISEYDNYRTDDGYLYVRIRAISSRVNKNHDGWPSIELAGDHDLFDKHQSSLSDGFTIEAGDGNPKYGFRTFVGKPIFVDHHNSNPDRARGVIVDAKLNVLGDGKTSSTGDDYWDGGGADPEHMPPTEIELLLEVDAKSFPKFAKAIRNGDLDGFSMGCDVERSKCSHCGNEATNPSEYCDHIQAKGANFDFVDSKTGKKTSKKSYENCYGIGFFEISGVFDPADETALAKEVRASVQKEGVQMRCPYCSGTGCAKCGNQGTVDVPYNTDGNFILDTDQTGVGTPVGMPGENTVEGPVIRETMGVPKGLGEVPSGPSVNDAMMAPHLTLDPVELRRKFPNLPVPRQGSVKTAENAEPQENHIKAPESVNTLRKEKICPVCGSDMDNEKCAVCGYVEPPEGFDNPDLNRHKEVQEMLDDSDGELTLEKEPLGAPDTSDPNVPQEGSYLQTRKGSRSQQLKDDMRWTPKVNSKVAGRINKVEKPLRPSLTPTTDEPNETVISDQSSPVTSTLRTARDMIEAAKRNKENKMADKTADAAKGAPDAATPDKRVDVEGVGGVDQASNEQASKADAQVDVMGKGGTGVEGVEADEHESIEETSDNAGFDNGGNPGNNSGPTKTWDGTGGNGVTRQTNPVTGKPFPESSVHEGYDSGPIDDGGQGSATQGVQPVDPSGKADDRVDVTAPVTTPENNSGKTKTWNGTGGNGVNRQQDPVTNVPTKSDGINSHVVAAMKQADTEVELGLIDKDHKYNRIAQLMELSPEELAAESRVTARVKTAGLARQSSVSRLPSFRQAANIDPAPEAQEIDDTLMDSAVFTR